ncbi:hypothetical protein J6I39_08965 [bacterium]|nr:hypothetical protein [bacterium]
MNEFVSKDIKNLFQNLCCSRCKNDFTSDSIIIKEREGDIFICNLTCQVCGKNFGNIVLRYNQKSEMHKALEIIDGPAPISSDDVIDAHLFIKKMK